ncbi:MAG: hypothetical protein GX332_07580, partial [Alcaligenaceae bacterium]|nr:hypothetical protein [Alcaligenaceae bacterium]
MSAWPKSSCCSHDEAHQPERESPTAASCCAAPTYTPSSVTPLAVQAGQELTRLRIEQMDCPVEEQLIRKKLEGDAQVIALQFHLMQRQLDVLHTADYGPQVVSAIQRLGMDPVLIQAGDQPKTLKPSHGKKTLVMVISAVFLALLAELGAWLVWPSWMVVALSVIAIALTGGTVYKKGLIALTNRNLNINALMSIAVTGAVLLGEWPEAAMVMSLFALAEYIEARSLDRARRAVDGLLALAPDEVEVFDEQGHWHLQPAQTVAAGSLVKVKPGARIGLDGVVQAGSSTVNQAPITGESLPVLKQSGDRLYAGSINGMGELQYRTQGTYDESLLARIAISVQQAQQSKAPVERFVDRFSQVYTPIVTFGALVLA